MIGTSPLLEFLIRKEKTQGYPPGPPRNLCSPQPSRRTTADNSRQQQAVSHSHSVFSSDLTEVR